MAEPEDVEEDLFADLYVACFRLVASFQFLTWFS
jgi:hypothetical protein